MTSARFVLYLLVNTVNGSILQLLSRLVVGLWSLVINNCRKNYCQYNASFRLFELVTINKTDLILQIFFWHSHDLLSRHSNQVLIVDNKLCMHLAAQQAGCLQHVSNWRGMYLKQQKNPVAVLEWACD